MRRLSWFNKVMFFFNIVLTILTFIAYVLPFLSPKVFPFLSVLSFNITTFPNIEWVVFFVLVDTI